MAFSLHPVRPEDAEDITRIFETAFKDDHLMGFFYPNTPAHLVWEKDLKYFSDLINEGDIYGGRFTKVVEEIGKTVAFSFWIYPYTLTEEQKKEKDEKEKKKEQEKPPHPQGSNGPLIDDFFKQLADGRKKWIVPEKTFFLHILAVDPAYQRKGLGSLLIRPGLEAADKAGAQTYVEASPAGLPLYLKHGWEPVDEMVIDMRPYGGHDIEHQKFLMREANAPNKLVKKVE